jgi:hypothetical protein
MNIHMMALATLPWRFGTRPVSHNRAGRLKSRRAAEGLVEVPNPGAKLLE